jgi:hypothetical protein
MILKKKTKEVWLCSRCNSNRVQYQVWMNPNTNKVETNILHEGKDGFCLDCQTHVKLYKANLKSNAKILGFQVVGKPNTKHDGDIHPNMAASFCIYSLAQADEMIKTGDDWRLLVIWSGDIEEGVRMFKGDPRD